MKECPTCHRPFERRGRWCHACNRPIRLRHKWHVDGSHIRHNDCGNPEMLQSLETPLLAAIPPEPVRPETAEGETQP